MATETKTKGFSLDCPNCGASETVHLNLEDIGTIRCNDCDLEMDIDTFEKLVATYTKFAGWWRKVVDLTPEYEG